MSAGKISLPSRFGPVNKVIEDKVIADKVIDLDAIIKIKPLVAQDINRPSLACLPQELIREIASCITAPYYVDFNQRHDRRKRRVAPVLRGLALISSTFYRIAKETALGHVYIRTDVAVYQDRAFLHQVNAKLEHAERFGLLSAVHTLEAEHDSRAWKNRSFGAWEVMQLRASEVSIADTLSYWLPRMTGLKRLVYHTDPVPWPVLTYLMDRPDIRLIATATGSNRRMEAGGTFGWSVLHPSLEANLSLLVNTSNLYSLSLRLETWISQGDTVGRQFEAALRLLRSCVNLRHLIVKPFGPHVHPVLREMAPNPMDDSMVKPQLHSFQYRWGSGEDPRLWLRCVDWSRLESFDGPSHPHGEWLVHQLTFLQHYRSTPVRHSEFDVDFLLKVPSYLASIRLEQWQDGVESAVLRHSSTLRTVVIQDHEYFRDICYGWNGRNPAFMSFASMRRICYMCRGLETFKFDCVYEADEDFDRMVQHLVSLPRLRIVGLLVLNKHRFKTLDRHKAPVEPQPPAGPSRLGGDRSRQITRPPNPFARFSLPFPFAPTDATLVKMKEEALASVKPKTQPRSKAICYAVQAVELFQRIRFGGATDLCTLDVTIHRDRLPWHNTYLRLSTLRCQRQESPMDALVRQSTYHNNCFKCVEQPRGPERRQEHALRNGGTMTLVSPSLDLNPSHKNMTWVF